MGEEKTELNESKLSNQSGYSPVKQVDDAVESPQDSNKLIVDIPNGKHNSVTANGKKRPSKDDSKYEMVPPDGGWGWLILFGATLVNMLIPGTIKSFGVLFVEFLEAFKATPSAAAWIPALCYFLYSSLGPLSSILSVKYSYRTVTLLGGAFAAVGMMITFYATSIEYLYISYGVLVGTGAGLSFPPTVYIVTSYFVRLRGLANGLCISGSALGSIFLPPLLRYLLENYGYRGACLIMGGITLNTLVAGLFYEPVERHMKRVLKEPLSEETMVEETIPEEPDEEDGAGDEKDRPFKAKFVITSDDTPCDTPTMDLKSPDFSKFRPNPDRFGRSASAAAVQNVNRSGDERFRKISTPIRNENRNATFVSVLSSSSTLNVPESQSSTRLNRFQGNRLSAYRAPKRSPSTSSFQYMSTPFHGSTLTMEPKEFASRLSMSSLNPVASCVRSKKEGSDEGETDSANKKGSNQFIDLSLLKDPTYLIILISNSTNAIGYTNFIILLPTYAITLGFDKGLAAYLLSIVSALDLVGRIGGSALSDMNLMPKTWYFVGGLAISGISLAVLPFFTSYTMISVFCALFGLSSGVYVGITAVIMADMLGTERLTSTYGISLFVNGILQLIGPPLCGLLFEWLQVYGPLFHILGLILLAGSGLWGFIPFINRRKAEAAAEEENQKSLLA